MAKTNITQYSSTPSENTDIDDINIDELCPASNLNNALRSLLSHLKNVDTGSQALTALSVTGALSCGAFTSNGIDDNADAVAITIDSSERVGIGNSTPSSYQDGATNLVVGNTSDTGMTIASGTSNLGSIFFADGTSGGAKYEGQIRYNHGSNFMMFATGGSERMRIPTSDSRSVLSIGDTAVYTGITSTTATSSSLISMNSGQGSEIVLSHHDALSTSGLGSIAFNRGSAQLSAIGGACDGATDSGNLKFYTTPSSGSITERMRITDQSIGGGGHTLGNATITGTGFNFRSPTDGTYLEIGHITGAGNGYSFIVCRYNGSSLGGISQNGTTGVDFDTTSDYRLKENVTYNFDATTRLKQLQPCRFNFISEPNKTIDGFLAHEVADAVPQAIRGQKDSVDEDGNIDPQMIDHSKLVPLLVKTIQELEARITALENA